MLIKNFLFLLFLMIPCCVTAQHVFQPHFFEAVDNCILLDYYGSRCLQLDTFTLAFDGYRRQRLDVLRGIFRPDEDIAYALYFAAGTGQPMYFIKSRIARASAIPLPLHYAGWYCISINDSRKPCLIVINATSLTAFITIFKICSIHDNCY